MNSMASPVTIRRMFSPDVSHADSPAIVRGLVVWYSLVAFAYILAVAALWKLGIEAIYEHPTPFYALIRPIISAWSTPLVLFWLVLLATRQPLQIMRDSRMLFYGFPTLIVAVFLFDWLYRRIPLSDFAGQWRHLPVLLLLVGFIHWLDGERIHRAFSEKEAPSNEIRRILFGLIVFSFSFAAAVAMLRGGLDGVSQAYQRHGYEYIDDIGIGGSIRGLFHDYLAVHPYLSMHSRVHPPGPVVILWLLSYLVGRTPLALSLATMALGALALLPLYAWARDMAGRRVALTCCILYVFMPSIVLFTAASADIAFMPFTLLTLFLFWRALHRGSLPYAAAAGLMYAVLSVISFSLVGLGAFFGILGLWRLRDARLRWNVLQTAAVMAACLGLFHYALWLWSGFDIIECFRVAKAQFDLDQRLLDQYAPRFPSWTWKFLNPACWFFFAGVPVSLLFIRRLRRPQTDTKGLFIVFVLTLLALDFLYLARGEGERSAMYVLPFIALPAAHALDEFRAQTGSLTPLAATVGFLGIQTWAMESVLYTYW